MYTTAQGMDALFTYQNGIESTFTIPSATSISSSGGLSSNGALVGSYDTSAGSVGFTLVDGDITTFSYPGAKNTNATGINAAGQIIGLHDNSGFLFQNGQYYPMTAPGQVEGGPFYINDQGTIVGERTRTNSKQYVTYVATCKSGPGTCTP